jgi:membrane associated rhomboid family serine protease
VLFNKRLWPSICLSLLCMVGMALPKATFGEGCAWWGHVLYHFSHANIYHLILNLWGLFAFRPRFSTCVIAFISSTLASLIPFACMSSQTCGLSGFLMASYARKYAEYELPLWRPIVANMLFVCFPMFNWRIHLLSFFIAYVIWVCRRMLRA